MKHLELIFVIPGRDAESGLFITSRGNRNLSRNGLGRNQWAQKRGARGRDLETGVWEVTNLVHAKAAENSYWRHFLANLTPRRCWSEVRHLRIRDCPNLGDIVQFIIRDLARLSAALRMPEPEILHTTGARPT